MSRALRTVFGVHAVVAAVFGLPLLIAPGRLLSWIGWAPIDPIASRLLGAALLALGWSSFRGWQVLRPSAGQVAERRDVAIVVELEAVFTVLASLGLGRHLLLARYPIFPWLVFGLFLAFAVAWVFFLVKRE